MAARYNKKTISKILEKSATLNSLSLSENGKGELFLRPSLLFSEISCNFLQWICSVVVSYPFHLLYRLILISLDFINFVIKLVR